jgi:pyruvate/2-oxoglutarate dehydrogenase complex dihydrolipoamide acyltransferase (E2) component
MNYYVQTVPMVSVNDEKVTLAEWYIAPGQMVKRGDTICCIETSKAVADVQAEADGYFSPLVEVNNDTQIGEPFA